MRVVTDIEKDVGIDKYHLDEEAKKLPSLVSKYHSLVFEKTEELNELEFELEKEEAVARKDARALFNAKGIKATVDMIADEVCALPAIQQLRKKVAHAKTEVAYIKGVLVALDAKKASLNNLASLYVRDYWSAKAESDGRYNEADVKHASSKDYDDMSTAQESSLAQAMRKRRS